MGQEAGGRVCLRTFLCHLGLAVKEEKEKEDEDMAAELVLDLVLDLVLALVQCRRRRVGERYI